MLGKKRSGMDRRTGAAPRNAGYTMLEVLVSISALALGLVAAYAAQLSANDLGKFSRETDIATFTSSAAIEMTIARSFTEMIDPDPPSGSIDTSELVAFQPPYDPRGVATFSASPKTYPDAPKKDYVATDPALYGKVLLYGARIWEPVTQAVVKTDPATGVSYKINPIGMLQKPKVLVWFEPRPTKLSGTNVAFESPVVKNNQFGFPKLVPQLVDPTDESSSMPATVVVSIGWFQQRVDHGINSAADFNPMCLFIPPADGSATFTASESNILRDRRETLKVAGMRTEIHRTVVKQ